MMLTNRALIFTVIFFLIKKSSQKYKWRGCDNPNPPKCEKFEKPPMVLLSLDGFRNEYLDRNIVRTLDFLSQCGTKAKHIYPSYPSKTFPNHYTIVTGLYPESHGIIDNSIFDETTKKFVNMRFANSTKYYGGEPIWSMYKRSFPTKKVMTYFWPGSEMNLHPAHPIDDVRSFNSRIPFEDRLSEIVNQLENKTSPGLIIAYHDQPDSTGHANINKEHIIKETLHTLDSQLDFFITQLYEKGLLECINLVIVSDHAEYMQKVVFKDDLIGTMHNVKPQFIPEIYEKLACKIYNVSVYTKHTMPTRKHYGGNARIGNIILEGQPGTTFGAAPHDKQGDHGYDFLNENMFAIFVGRGPAFKKGVTIEPFQNVQLMNLWIDLLEIPRSEKFHNNGTIGFFDSVLVNPRRVYENETRHISECKVLSATPVATMCLRPSKSDKTPNLNCKKTGHLIPFRSNNPDFCYESYCQDNVIKHKKSTAIITISEPLKRDKSGPNNIGNMTFYDANYKMNTDPNKCEDMGKISFSFRKTLVDTFISDADFSYFNEKVIKPLDYLTSRYLKAFKILHILSGTTVDADNNGVLDNPVSRTAKASHFYRIIIICPDGFRTVSPPRCKTPKKMKTLSFIFPMRLSEPKAWTCLSPNQLLKDYSATVADVESITGLRFQIDYASTSVNAKIRQRITESFWSAEKNHRRNIAGLPSVFLIFALVLVLVL